MGRNGRFSYTSAEGRFPLRQPRGDVPRPRGVDCRRSCGPGASACLNTPGLPPGKTSSGALSRLPDGPARELAADPDVFAGQQRYAIRINDEITVDVLPSAAGHDWDELKRHIVEHDIDGVRVKVLEGLLKTKEVARPKDQSDADVIRRAIELLKGN